MQKIAFILNSTVSKFEKCKKEIEECFTKDAFEIKIFISQKSRHVEKLSREALAESFDHLIFVGGDGTLNEGLNGILQFFKINDSLQLSAFDLEKLNRVKVGLLPNGSGNDFAKTIQISRSVEVLKANIINQKFQKIDIGFAKFLDTEKIPTCRFYANITDIGMGGIIAKKVVHKNKAFSADFIYIQAIFSTLLSYKKSKVKYTSDVETWESNIMSLIFANGQFFGSGLGVSPKSSIQDGILNVVKLGDINVFDYIYHLKDLKRSKEIQHKEISYSTAKRLKVESTENIDLPIDMDGEFVGYAPLEIEVIPLALRFIF